MDIIVIGKESHGKSDKPVVVYCGQSREEAIDAVIKADGKFERFYYVNPEPFQKIRSPEALRVERAESEARTKARQNEEKDIHDRLRAEDEKVQAEKKRLAEEEEAAREQYRREEEEREAALRAPKAAGESTEAPVKRGRRSQS